MNGSKIVSWVLCTLTSTVLQLTSSGPPHYTPLVLAIINEWIFKVLVIGFWQ